MKPNGKIVLYIALLHVLLPRNIRCKGRAFLAWERGVQRRGVNPLWLRLPAAASAASIHLAGSILLKLAPNALDSAELLAAKGSLPLLSWTEVPKQHGVTSLACTETCGVIL